MGPYTAAVGIPEHTELSDRFAGCARCGHATTAMTPVGQVISRRFTGYESWTNLAGRHLCQVCVWVYRHRPLRSEVHIVTRSPATLQAANPSLLRQVLAAPVGADTLVIVPLRPGRKHLLPDARWGFVVGLGAMTAAATVVVAVTTAGFLTAGVVLVARGNAHRPEPPPVDPVSCVASSVPADRTP